MHPKQAQFEEKLTSICIQLDEYLEDTYAGSFVPHPNRLARGEGANPCYDGLFSTSASFSLGYGTKSGRGYIFNVELRSLQFVPAHVKDDIKQRAFTFIEKKLPEVIPDRKLELILEDGMIKLIGDFTLGTL